MKNRLLYSTIVAMMFLSIAFLLTPMIPIACSWSNHGWKQQIEGSFFSVFALDEKNVWASGAEGCVNYYDGEKWENQQGGAAFYIKDIVASDPNNIWGIDYSGMAYRSGGSQWDVEYETGERLHCITAGDGSNVWVGGEEGGIYHYDGRAWSEQVELGEAILDMDSTDPGHVWAVGGRYYESQESTRPEGPGHVYFYNGESWSEYFESEEMLYGVSAFDENHVWVSGDEGSIFFYDGNGWSRMESPTTYALVAVSAADPEHVWTITQFGGLVLFYDGSDWAIQHRFELEEGEEGIIELNDIYAADKDNVWLAGIEGLYNKPK